MANQTTVLLRELRKLQPLHFAHGIGFTGVHDWVVFCGDSDGAYGGGRLSFLTLRESAGRYGEVHVTPRELDAELTAALRQAVAGRGSAALRDVILAAMVEAERAVFGRDHLAAQLEGHGRDGWGANLEVSRTVGWFTSLYPCVLKHRAGERETEAAARVAASLASLPDAGATYSLLRMYGPDLARGREMAVRTTIGFNYLGEFIASSGKALFRIDGELPPGAIAPDFPRDHPRDVTAWIFEGRLHVQCAFLPTTECSLAMECWMDQVMRFLRRVVGK